MISCRVCQASYTPVPVGIGGVCDRCAESAVRTVEYLCGRAALALPEHWFHVSPFAVGPGTVLRPGVARNPANDSFYRAGFDQDTGILVDLKAADGHLCSSMLEKAVDDCFNVHGIGHTREPLCPVDEQLEPATRRRADWLLGDGTFVEMWGMPEDRLYAEKMREKIELAQRQGLSLIGLLPDDVGRLREIFAYLAKE